jgi:hypothetical protein
MADRSHPALCDLLISVIIFEVGLLASALHLPNLTKISSHWTVKSIRVCSGIEHSTSAQRLQPRDCLWPSKN